MRLAVLISGNGGNMVAIAEACRSGRLHADIAVVIADTAAAPGIARAAALGLPTLIVDRHAFQRDGKPDRNAFEAALMQGINDSRAELVILAGFMRVLSAPFVHHFAGRLLNIHPSLLPAHKGLNTHQAVLSAGEREHGATVHFVTAELDGGPLIAQGIVTVLPEDDVASLSARVHAREHMIYPMAIEWLIRRRLQWNDGRPVLDGLPLAAPVQMR